MSVYYKYSSKASTMSPLSSEPKLDWASQNKTTKRTCRQRETLQFAWYQAYDFRQNLPTEVDRNEHQKLQESTGAGKIKKNRPLSEKNVNKRSFECLFEVKASNKEELYQKQSPYLVSKQGTSVTRSRQGQQYLDQQDYYWEPAKRQRKYQKFRQQQSKEKKYSLSIFPKQAQHRGQLFVIEQNECLEHNDYQRPSQSYCSTWEIERKLLKNREINGQQQLQVKNQQLQKLAILNSKLTECLRRSTIRRFQS